MAARGRLTFVSGRISPLLLIVVSVSMLLAAGIVNSIEHAGRHLETATFRPGQIAQFHGGVLPMRQGFLPDTPPDLGNEVPVLWRVPTQLPVIFLGIDDGWIHNKDAAQWLASHKLPFTLFLTDDAIKADYGYFAGLQSSGMNIQNHTLSHPDLTKMNYEQQKAEICGQSDKLAAIYGKRPTLFRPPFGFYNETTRQVVKECGMKAMILWHAKADGGSLQFQDTDHFEAGDIILMHFRPKFIEDMTAFMAEVDAQQLTIGNLEDWVR